MSDRHHERIPVALEVEYRTAGAFLVAYSSNLSKGGIYLETDTPPPIGTELALKFTIPAMGKGGAGAPLLIEVRGLVAWVRTAAQAAVDGKPAGMGVEFEHLDQRHGDLIDRIVSVFQGLKVLVLASSPHGRQLLARAVRSILASAEVLEAMDADTAEKAFRHEPDLAIIDLDDSSADGLLTLRLAKTHASRPLPVIAASREDNARKRARELGADEVLHTPIGLTELQAAILRAMGKPLRIG
jgi:uncharacterized protein (TIGR02266 family)